MKDPRRVVLTVVLSVVAGLSLVVSPWTATPAYAADARPVLAALKLLHEQHVDAPDEVKLLQAALEGIRRELQRSGVTLSAAVEGGVVGLDATVALTEFQTRYDEAVALAAGRIDEIVLREAAIRSMADLMDDSHTGYLTPQQWMAFRERLGNQRRFTGIGVILVGREGRVYVRHVLAQSPAANAGVRDFDRIVAINGISIHGLSLDEVRTRLRGEEGSSLALTLQRPGAVELFTVTLTRGNVASPNVLMTRLDGGVGYLRLLEFAQGSAELLRAALTDLQSQPIRVLVLDLRGNVGGLVSELNLIADMLLPAGLPIYTLSTRGSSNTYVTKGTPLLPAGVALSVLVDQGTASAAEVLSAAIEEHRRGVVVGLKTAGAVLAARLFPLPDGSALSITIARMTTGQGRTLERIGVEPGVVADMTAADLDRGVDTVIARALEAVLQRAAGFARSLLRRAA